MGPDTRPCRMRPTTSIVMLLDSPHNAENTTNNVPETVNVRTSPKRRPSQPVSGCMMAAASV